MTSPATSGWQQIAQTRSFWVKFWSRFLDNSSTDSEKVYCFGVLETVIQWLHSPFYNLFKTAKSEVLRCEVAGSQTWFAFFKPVLTGPSQVHPFIHEGAQKRAHNWPGVKNMPYLALEIYLGSLDPTPHIVSSPIIPTSWLTLERGTFRPPGLGVRRT